MTKINLGGGGRIYFNVWKIERENVKWVAVMLVGNVSKFSVILTGWSFFKEIFNPSLP